MTAIKRSQPLILGVLPLAVMIIVMARRSRRYTS